jgi:hypothetical protein
MRGLGKTSSAGLFHAYRVVGEHGVSLTVPACSESAPHGLDAC